MRNSNIIVFNVNGCQAETLDFSYLGRIKKIAIAPSGIKVAVIEILKRRHNVETGKPLDYKLEIIENVDFEKIGPKLFALYK